MVLHISSVQDRRVLPGVLAHPVIQLGLLGETQIGELDVGTLANVGRNDVTGVANQEAIDDPVEPRPVDLIEQVKGHVLVKHDPLAGRRNTQE